MLGILALFGPSAFGFEIGFLSLAYSVVLVAYALWAMRLTVVFRDDESLGLLLSIFDVTLTLPLIVWGSGPSWLAAPLVAMWGAGFLGSLTDRRGARTARSTTSTPLVDPVTKFYSRNRFSEAIEAEAERAASRRESFALVTLRVQRYGELLACNGPDAVDRALASLARRASHELGPVAEGYRLSDDLLAVIVPTRGPIEASEQAGALSRAANGRLIDGRRVDTFVGYAVFPRDGRTPTELLRAAEGSTPARVASRTHVGETAERAGRVAVAGSQVALG